MTLAALWTIGPDPCPWLLGSSGLAPNHWFSSPVVRSELIRPALDEP